MKITSKSEYAVISMIYLGERYDKDEYVSLNDIAQDNNLSIKYLEKIFADLKKADFFISGRGKVGGYKLKRKPDEYTMYEIMKAAEGRVSPVQCLETGVCKNGICISYPLWHDMFELEKDFLKKKTLKDYIRGVNND